MRQLYRFMAVLAALGGLALSPPLSAQLSGGGTCQMMTMADGSKVQMCKDAQGNWVQQQTQQTPSASSNGFPRRAEVVWQGTYDITASKPGRVKNLSLGGLLNAATSGQSQRYTGRIEFRATITGDQVVVQLSGTNFAPEELFGTMRGGVCRFEIHNGKVDEAYEGRCDAEGFVGQMSGKDGRGNNQKGSFTTSTAQLTDLDLRDRQQAEQRAENERKAAAQRAENERKAKAAAAELAAKPNASAAQARALESAVAQDSGAWSMNRYNSGSIRKVKLLSSGSTQRIRGEYTFNGGSTGWVEADVTGGQVQCLQYWDTGYCSSVRRGQAGGDTDLVGRSAYGGTARQISSYQWFKLDSFEYMQEGNRARSYTAIAAISKIDSQHVKYLTIETLSVMSDFILIKWNMVNCADMSVQFSRPFKVQDGKDVVFVSDQLTERSNAPSSGSHGYAVLARICKATRLERIGDPVAANLAYTRF